MLTRFTQKLKQTVHYWNQILTSQDLTTNFAKTPASKFMRICSVFLEVLRVDTSNKTLSMHATTAAAVQIMHSLETA